MTDANEGPSRRPGDQLPGADRAAVQGRFELLQELGRGSSGTVYRARLVVPYSGLPAGSEVAIKFLRQELADDERAQARLFAEGELGQKLRHPNVAAIFGVETAEHLGVLSTFLVMQYVKGTTLREFVLRSGSPVEDLTRRIGADACKGLAVLHKRGLVHRDIKPENLILTPDGELKIVDLGLARPFGSRGGGSGSGSGSGDRSSGGLGLHGSLAYAAPELLRGEAASPRSDLYALGVVLYEVTTGQHPFVSARSPDDMLDAHLNRKPAPPSHHRPRVSPFLEQVLLDLLQKAPDERPRDAADLARILEQGERSDYWRRQEQRLPVLASSRRLLRLRRPAETAFYGRSAETAVLDKALQSSRSGKGRVVLVTGPEGIGRRRLFDEVVARWLAQPKAPLYCGGEADSDLGHGEPFAGAVVDLLLRGDDRHSPNSAQRALEQARAVFGLPEPEAQALVAAAFGHSTEPPEVRAERLATALLRLGRKDQPLVVRVDHAEELDTSGRLVLQRLASAAPTAPLLVLLAAGADGVRGELPQLQRLDLLGLDDDDFLEFGRALFRADEDVDAFLRSAHQVLSGLPGNLLEALDHLVQSGELRGRPGDYHGLPADAEARPAPRHLDRFRARVQALSAAQRTVLETAAVLGERCALADLAALAGASSLAVLETLSVFRGRIVRAQGGEVSFRHRDFQKQLLRELAPERAQALHRAAAALLQSRGASPLVVGMHLSQGGDHEGCVDPLLAGLEERVRAGSRRTALRLVGRLALHLQQLPPSVATDRRRLRWLLASGQARTNNEQHDAAARVFREAEALARTVGDDDASASARTGLATAELDSGRLLSAIALLESVHDDLLSRHNPRADSLAAQAHGLHGRILLYRGQAADGLKQLQAALHRLPASDGDLRCHLEIDLARIEALAHHYGKALRTLGEVEREPSTRHLPRVRLRFHLYRGQIRAIVGDDEAVQDLRFAIDEAERLSLPTYGARAADFLGERQFGRNRDDEARATFELARRLGRSGGDRLGEAMARIWLVRLGADDPDLVPLLDDLALPSLRANWLLALAARGRLDDAGTAALEELVGNSDLPLAVHLRALAWFERPATARAMVRSIAERLAPRSLRQRFLAQWQDGARI
ncbi:MAG: serine/threonine-protein kinase PknK [Planctomycetes bacterium]|nr:serine/threonine-protein kinase PknK [Planctomycetota bacterium]